MYLASLPDLKVVGEAADGESALEICPIVQPEVVLLDINMPGMDGFEAARLLLERHSHLWIIGVSADASLEVQQQAAEVGLRAVIAKDMLIDYLVPAISSLIDL